MSPELKKLLIEWHDRAAVEACLPCNSAAVQRQALDDVAFLEILLFDSRPLKPETTCGNATN